MGQVTIYLDGKTEAEMKAAVKAAGISESKWIAQAIHEKAVGKWPEPVTRLDDAWPDIPMAEDIRCSGVEDTSREPL